MKKILLAGFLGLGLVGCVSMPTPTDKPMTDIVEVVDVGGKTKDQLFEQSKVWIARSFKSANNVIQYQDKASGRIIGKGNIPFPCSGFIDCGAFGKDKVNFTIQIDTKDNKARVFISDITATSLTYVQGGINNIGQERPILILEHQQRIDAKLKEVVQQYKTDVVKQQVDNNW
ncbi:DUF4468 domain-containing protein [Acinetobacter baumannii]|nr:DUF4468 domain-containing protein [Acinetobacter baumannii]